MMPTDAAKMLITQILNSMEAHEAAVITPVENHHPSRIELNQLRFQLTQVLQALPYVYQPLVQVTKDGRIMASGEIMKKCELCGEYVKPDQGAEMYDACSEGAASVYCHAECGLAAGMEVA